MASAFQGKSHFEQDSPRASAEGRQAVNTGTRGDDASSIDHVHEKAAPTPVLTKRQKVKRHCGRFWLWYLIASIILLAILLPIIFKVILPKIVQDIVNDQAMPVNGGSFLALSPTELSVSLDTSLNTPLGATIEPLTLFLYNKNTTDFSPFLNLTLPEQYVKGQTNVTVTNQTVTISNETELVSWFNDVFVQAETQLSFKGDTTVKLGSLSAGVTVDKTIEVQSLNNLAGFGITNLQLMIPADSNGNNVKGTVNLPNWGVLTLGLGDITLNLLSGNLNIGYVTIQDVVLPPGNNSMAFAGQLYLNTIIDNIGNILTTQASALSDGNIVLGSIGNSTIINGEHITFVEAILNNHRLTSSMSVISLVSDVASGFLGGNTSITQLFGDIFGNSTLIQEIASHWNTTALEGDLAGLTGNDTLATAKKMMKRAGPRGTMAWNMMKLGMKMGKR
ncbi:hypothetical protein BX600DRAFT_511405 [Xylariales sp. PMI_506]|nr:hypothetical protein BX600DRAFT_511405 [Xylariales sp. PMI_506]